jgi:hypothetical protein
VKPVRQLPQALLLPERAQPPTPVEPSFDTMRSRALAGLPIVVKHALAGEALQSHVEAIDTLLHELGLPIAVIYAPGS